MPLSERLEAMLAAGQDSAILRFSLGSEYLRAGRCREAGKHLALAVQLDPQYSAAWKLLGRALAEAGETRRAMDAFRQGIAVANARGDIQAAKEMGVFLRRIEKTSHPDSEGNQT